MTTQFEIPEQHPGTTPYAAPAYASVQTVPKSSGLAVGAMILGLGAIFFSILPFIGVFSIPFAACGLGLGLAGMNQVSEGYAGKGMAVTGILTSATALLVQIVALSS